MKKQPLTPKPTPKLTTIGISVAVKARVDRYCTARGIIRRTFVDQAVTDRLKKVKA